MQENNALLSRPPTAFSMLGKRKALDTFSDNVRPAKRTATAPSKPVASTLTQMQISLGQEVQKKCKTCGMEYVISSSEDRKLHDKYHKQSAEGFDVGKDFVLKARNDTVFKVLDSEDVICALDCSDKPARKRRGQAVLEIVQRELGSVVIPEKSIWEAWEVKGRDVLVNGEPEFRAYLYIRRMKCISFLLVQMIQEAYRVVEPARPPEESTKTCSARRTSASGSLTALKARQQAASKKVDPQACQPIEISKALHPASIGISRIWTSPNYRHQNIATSLLDTALSRYRRRADRHTRAEIDEEGSFKRGLSDQSLSVVDALIPALGSSESKDLVAFSQPTEAGVRLARRWFGKMYGWSVYVA